MSVDACAKLVQEGDPLRFRAALTAPLPVRADLLVLHAFNIEVSRAPWVTSEPMIAQMRLQWWIDALQEIRDGTPRRHEVVTPLADVVARRGLDVAALVDLVEARRFDIERDPHANFEAFLGYVRATFGTHLCAGVRVCGGPDDVIEIVQEFGLGVGIAAQMVALQPLLAAGRNPLWGGDHDRAAASRGTPDTLSIDMVSTLANRALDALTSARARRRASTRENLPAMIIGHNAHMVLERAKSRPEQVFLPGFGEVNALLDRLSFWRVHLTGRW